MSYCTIEEAWGGMGLDPSLDKRKKRKSAKKHAATKRRHQEKEQANTKIEHLHDYSQADGDDYDEVEPSIDTYQSPTSSTVAEDDVEADD